MSRKRYTQEQIIGKLQEAEVAFVAEADNAQVCRSLDIAAQTFYRWRGEFGGLKREQAKRLKALEQEHARLRRAVADLTLDRIGTQTSALGPFPSSILAQKRFLLVNVVQLPPSVAASYQAAY